MEFIRIYYEVCFARDTCLSTPNSSEIFQLSLRLSCNCSSAALLSVKSGDYTLCTGDYTLLSVKSGDNTGDYTVITKR